ncbi:MAG TPA: Gfo/Idh/MocA family oxidoreductase [Tepidisphaeraceae bacterium]|jgi:predicted dehydrogenase
MTNVGIIGFGRIGAEHAGWLSKAEGIRAFAAFDPTEQRRALAESRGLHPLTDPDRILSDSSIHAVLISTPTAMHFEHAKAAVAAGKHVMVEKPMALDAAQARQLIEAAASRQLVLSVFHNRRWDIDYLTVKSAMEAGTFGRIINVESRISQWASCVGPAAKEWRPNWRNEAAHGGGGLYDWGSHLIDQIWQLMLPAKPTRVFAQLRGNVWSKDCDDFARVIIDFDNGAVGMVEINTTTTAPLPRWHIDGTLGAAQSPASLQYDTREWAQLRFGAADGSPPRMLDLAGAGLDETAIWTRFGRAIRGEDEPAVAPASVLPTMCLLDAARLSSRNGISIDVREVRESKP